MWCEREKGCGVRGRRVWCEREKGCGVKGRRGVV